MRLFYLSVLLSPAYLLVLGPDLAPLQVHHRHLLAFAGGVVLANWVHLLAD